ncbi:MAG: hypothetical protein ACI30W_02225 [Muribaculaceae bacterium]
MKKTLLSLMCVAAFGYANAEVVNLNCNDVDLTQIEGTYVETTYNEDETVKAYAHWQPVESLVLGGFTFSFYAPDSYMDGETEKTTTQPAFYTAKEGNQYTIRVYAATEMTITAPEGSLMTRIETTGSKANASLVVTPDAGEASFEPQKLTWGVGEGADGVASVKLVFNGTYRINTLAITLGEKGEEPVGPEVAAFERVGNEIVSGKRYVFAIPGDGAMQVASNIDESKSYGRLALVNTELDGNANIVCPETYAITITETSEGYTLKDEFGRFIGFDSNYPTSFQLYTEAGANAYWNLAEIEGGSVEFESTVDNTAIICQAYGDDGTPFTNIAVAVAPAEYNQPILFVEVTAGVEDVAVDANAPAEFFNLQGVRVAVPTSGLYIRRQGNTATKVLVK